MINWEVILWTCITLAVLMGIIATVLSFISAKNMRKRREQMAEIHTTLTIGSKVMFAGGIYGKCIALHNRRQGIEGEGRRIGLFLHIGISR